MYKIIKKAAEPERGIDGAGSSACYREGRTRQFVILRSDEGRSTSATIADFDRNAGTITVIFQTVGGGHHETRHAGEKQASVIWPVLLEGVGLEGLKKCVLWAAASAVR